MAITVSNPFDYTAIQNTAIGLIKQFGRQTPCNLVRPVEASPPNPAAPWRLGAPASFQFFPFIGVVSTLGFPKRADPQTDQELDILAPGDITSTPGTVTAGGAQITPQVLCGPPVLDDRVQVTWLGNLYTYLVLGVKDVTPNAVAIMFTLRCKAFPDIVQQAQIGIR